MPAQRDRDGRLQVAMRRRVYEQGIPVDVTFVEADGRLVPARVELGADFDDPNAPEPVPVTTKVWRSIPVGKVVDEALASHVKALQGALERPDEQEWSVSGVPVSGLRKLREPLTRAIDASAPAKKLGRPRLYDDEHYRQVAHVYNTHSGRAPTKAVADHFFKGAKSMAAKHVAEARARKGADGKPLIPPWEDRNG